VPIERRPEPSATDWPGTNESLTIQWHMDLISRLFRVLRLWTRAATVCALSTPAACGAGADVLQLYTSLDAEEATSYIEAFERDTGIRVRWVRLSAGETLARLEAERNNPQVSVWFGGPSPEYMVAAERALLEPYQPPLEHSLPASAHAANWEWTGFYSGVIGFACYQPWFDQRGSSCPESWQDLLDPSLRSQISLAYPYTSGTAYITLVGLLALLGDETGWAYVRQLDQQVHRYNSSGTAAVTQVGLGEVAVGIAFAHDVLKRGVERGYPVTLRIPRDGTAAEIGAVALVRGGPRPELGRQFIDWLLSRPAQDLLAEYYRLPLHPAARIAEGAVRPEDVHLVDYDVAAAAAQHQNNLARWRQITGR
jgi:iron(III) transport system substrate-binding protein